MGTPANFDTVFTVRAAPPMACAAFSLFCPYSPHVYQGIAVDGDERRLLVHRVDAREDDAVAAELIAGEFRRRFAVVRPVGSHEQDVERLVGQIGFHERIAQLGADAVVEVPESTL